MPLLEPPHLIALACGLLGVGCSLLLGKRKLEQATLLEEDLPPERLDEHVGRVVTLVGAPRSDHSSHTSRDRVLWYRRRVHRGRHQIRVESPPWPFFALDLGGRTVWVENVPTEVFGAEHRTTHSTSGRHRVRSETLRTPPQLTVCGQLVVKLGALWLVPDPRLGLSFSPEPPHACARRVRREGWLGLTLFPLVILALAAGLGAALAPLFATAG